MMSAAKHMALQGTTASVRAPVSLIKEGVENIKTGQEQENTFRAKQHATRITREQGKGNLNPKNKELTTSSKTMPKIVEKMRKISGVQHKEAAPNNQLQVLEKQKVKVKEYNKVFPSLRHLCLSQYHMQEQDYV